ncbi:MAG: sugar phosphate isomerase/epimerase [Chloroflexi bacterium]|nr:sugar phosphate isomerase/epimerase [Chloroflexota bacterium]
MKPVVALSTGSLHCYGLHRAFALAREAGFEAVEVMVDDRWDTRQPDYLRSLQQQHGVKVVCLHSPFLSSIPGWPSDEIGRLKDTLKIAETIGAQTVVTHLPFRWTRASLRVPFIEKTYHLHLPVVGDGRYTRFLTSELRQFQADTKVTIAVENMPYNHRILGRTASFYGLNTLPEIEQFDCINLDTTHLATHGQDILTAYDRLASRVVHVHLSNYKDGREHQLLWDGILPLDRLLQRLAASDFGGVVSVELEPRAMGAASEKTVRKNLRRCYEFCKANLGLN